MLCEASGAAHLASWRTLSLLVSDIAETDMSTIKIIGSKFIGMSGGEAEVQADKDGNSLPSPSE